MPDGNPYARMVSVMRGEATEQTVTGETGLAGLGAGPVKMRLGTVVQRTPLKIKVAGIEQPAEALKINERLTKGAKWKTRISAPVDVLDDPARRPAATFFGETGVYGPVNGTVACGGMSCAPYLTGITDGTLYSDGVLIDQTGQEQLEIDLDVDDVVLLLTEDDQVFYIIMKVVDAE